MAPRTRVINIRATIKAMTASVRAISYGEQQQK